MPWDALPPHLNTPEAWNGHDDDKHWYTKWIKGMKGLYAYSYRSRYWWARWEMLPNTLVAIKGIGIWRFEKEGYLSRCQYWTKWHVALQWPLFLSFHAEIKDMLIVGYIGAKRDADDVYWFPSIYLGRSWK